MPAPAPAAPGGRLAWADAAKGVCILLVVLHHATVKHLPSVVPAELAGTGEAWLALTAALKPIRMPLFFLLSGLFAAGAVRRPWSRVLTSRVLNPYWVYAVWLLALVVLLGWERTMVMNRTQDVPDLLADLAFASTGVWFLYALAAYFLVARATVTRDVRWVLGLAGALAVSVSALPLTDANREAVLVHLVYFLAGARLPELVHRLAARRRPALPLLAVAYAAAAALLALAGTPLSVEVTALSLLGVPLAVRAAVLVADLPGVGPLASALGRRTLPVYVLHMPVLAVVHHLPVTGDRLAGALASTGPYVGAALVVLYPLVVTAAVTVVALALHRLLLRCGLEGLFALPAALRPEEATLRRLGRSASRAVSRPPGGRGVGVPVTSRLYADPPSGAAPRVPAFR